MRFKTIFLSAFLATSTFTSAQFLSFSGGYSPTFESLQAGLGVNSNDFLMDFILGLSDEFISMGMDLSFTVIPDMNPSYNLTRLYFGIGGEAFLMDDYDREGGYALYGLLSLSHNLVCVSYGYGFYDYDGVPTGELDGYHKIKLAIFLGEVD